ncbi:MAG: hypothetical protein FJY07_10620 [Bacteroidetes bacterium]|nr:hypothetical protein [Bacteroidota bacterium]
MQAKVIFTRTSYKSILIDFAALTFIYFVPALSHLFNLPVYLIEPMRIMLVLAMVHTSKNNAYLLALTLPLFSFLVSSHPNIYKGLIMTAELVINVWLFFEISKRVANRFAAMLSSIIISKIIYYLLKFGLISFGLIESGLIATPVWLQILMAFILSGYIFLYFRTRELSKSDS